MELGQRLKEARLAAGLSQRQLCGHQLTRNMLSLIENGTARPSMDTLLYLASRLGKPVSFFLEEESVSPNQARLAAARTAYAQGHAAAALAALESCESPDPVFDGERYLLEFLCCLLLADGHADGPYLARAAEASRHTPYCDRAQEWRWLLLRGDEAVTAGDFETALKWFSLAEPQVPEHCWPRLEKCYQQLEDYKMAYHYACLQRK